MQQAWILPLSLLGLCAPFANAQTDWPMYAHDAGSTRYSPLAQITPANVASLKQAWTFDTSTGETVVNRAESRTTPLVIDGVMYFLTRFENLVAVEPETGKKLWSFSYKHSGRPAKGIAYWPGSGSNPATIFFGTDDGYMYAVNAKTGKLNPGFAKEGELELKAGMKDNYPTALYGLNGAPIVYKNLVITGSHVQDVGTLGGRGDVRAWDASTGKLVWTFHTVPQPGEPGHETWLDDGWKDRSGANVWSTFTLDAKLGTLLMPIGSASDDRYGGDRPGANLYANTLVAVDALTGKLKWHFQTVHHDLWDYDLPPQPTLIDVTHDGKKIPALIQGTKTGLLFILDRRTGKPIYGVEERPVPKGDVPGEWYSPTQPFPVKPPQLARHSWAPGELTAFTPAQKKYCEDLFQGAHNEGPFSPIRLTNTVLFPGPDGGFNWGGGSYDPKLGYFFINSHDQGEVTKMIERKTGEGSQKAVGNVQRPPYVRQNAGSPVNPTTGWPCQSPPWGELFAINVNTGDVAWRIPFGTIPSLEALGVKDTGSYNIGGSVVTASGLLFIGATQDGHFHAYESKTGKLLWDTKLPEHAYANPITYQGKDKKQYVVIDSTDTLFAFALP